MPTSSLELSITSPQLPLQTPTESTDPKNASQVEALPESDPTGPPSESGEDSASCEDSVSSEGSASSAAATQNESVPQGDPAADSPKAADAGRSAADERSAAVEEAPVAAEQDSAPAEPAKPSLPGVPKRLERAMLRQGFESLTAVQSAVLAEESRGRDLQISSQTGSGKTVALGLALAPELLEEAPGAQGPTALVVVPTRELATQIQEELGWLFADVSGVTIDCVTGGTSTWQERSRLRRHPRVLVGTPGRLLDHLTSGALQGGDVAHLVLDEADQMLDMGFRDELEAILGHLPAERRTHLVSATFPQGIRALAGRHQRDPLTVEGTAHGEANADIEHVAHLVNDRNRYAALVNLLLLADGERTLVFVNTRADTARIADQLCEDGFSALALSGELQQSQRTRTLAAFRAGAVSVLVATDVAARGLDVPDVATVVHAAPPSDGEGYVHRSGRTGRAGNKGKSVVLAPIRKERAMRRIFAEAGMVVDWQPLPASGEVRKAIVKRDRRRVFQAIDAEPGPSEEQLEFARRLLDARDPERIVAVLLEKSRKSASTDPREVGPAIAPSGDRGHRGRSDRGGDDRRGPSRGGPQGDASRYVINWGKANGASPQRILAHVCRRGGVSSRQVGAIRLDERESTFELERGAARGFEAKIRGRDSRDPHLFIRPAGAGAGRPQPYRRGR